MLLEDPENLEVLKEMPHVESLWLRHFRRVQSLEPLNSLKNLRELDLRTLPSWDASSRNLVVESFEPLAALPKLEKITTKGVIPKQGRLEPLGRIATLSQISINSTSNFYQLEDFASLSAALPNARGLKPARTYHQCTRCREHLKLFLKGSKPRQSKSACPACERKRLIDHLERWNAAGGLPKYDELEHLGARGLTELFHDS